MASSMEADETSYKRLANDVYVYGNVSLALALAKETHLVSCLCAAQSPLTSAQMAEKLQLKERYVRELLNSLTVAGLVHLEDGSGGREGREGRYWVPPTLRPHLQRAGVHSVMVSSSAKRFAAVRKCVDIAGPDCVEEDTDESESYEALDEWAISHVDCITEGILQTPGLKARLEHGIRALEVGCGTGRLSLHLASLFPNTHFLLTDLEEEPLKQVQKRAEELNLPNVSCQKLDVLRMLEDFRESFDWLLACYVIHDLPRPSRAMREICGVLKPGGHFSMVELLVSSYVAENVKSGNKAAAALYSMGVFNCIPEASAHGTRPSGVSQDKEEEEEEDVPGACLGEENTLELAESAGMRVLGLARSPAMGTTAVCMCQKPPEGGGE